VRRPPADVLLLATVTLWALNFTSSKYILTHGMRPLSYSSVRYACAAGVFLALTYPRERSFRVGRGDVPLVALCVGVLFLNQLCFIYALDFTTAATTALLFGTLPIFAAGIARLVGMERLSLRFWLAALLSLTGVALVTVGSGGGFSANVKGDLLAIGGAATWATYSVALAPLMRRYSPFRLSAVFLLAVTVPLAIAGAGQLDRQSFDLGWGVWGAFTFAVLGPLVTTNLLWFTAVARVGPSRAALFANLQPFLGAVAALLLLSERIHPVQVAGGLLIAAGIVLSPRAAAPEPPAD
jgi:drug/metabolite transporter (DMT)-like permease